MSIWKHPWTMEAFEKATRNTIDRHLGIELVEIGDDFLRASLPVDERTRQPYGLLHGGASAVLAETLGSMGAAMTIDHATQRCVGLEINVNHLRGVREGKVIGTAKPLHVGRRTQVWEIRIENEAGKLTAVSRLTVAVIES